MKNFLLLNILLISIKLFGQDADNDCYEFMTNEQNKHFTNTTRLSNGAMLYYQWNCDSTWLTFENEKNRTILKSCSDFDPILCSRLGLNYIKEYPRYLLFTYEWISGCCTPPDLVFINKDTGKEKERITSNLFVWGDADKNYALYFSDSSYSNLIYLNHMSGQKITYQFKKIQVLKSIQNHSVLQLGDLFRNYRNDKEYFIFDFKNYKGKIEKIKIRIE